MFPYKIATIDSGFAFVNNIESLNSNFIAGFVFVNNIESLNFNFIAGCFLVGVGFLGYGGPGVWFLNDSISCPKQQSLKITFIV